MKITIRHSKTNQEGADQTIAIPPGKIACPVVALKEWISVFAGLRLHRNRPHRPMRKAASTANMVQLLRSGSG
jgi:hypothetical protein